MADPDPWASAKTIFSDWMMPAIMLFILLYGAARRVSLYQSFIAGAKEAFQLAVGIIPFLVAILAAIGMFRASGSMDVVIRILKPILEPIGLPAESLPMILIRPLRKRRFSDDDGYSQNLRPRYICWIFCIRRQRQHGNYILCIGRLLRCRRDQSHSPHLMGVSIGRYRRYFISLLICRWFF